MEAAYISGHVGVNAPRRSDSRPPQALASKLLLDLSNSDSGHTYSLTGKDVCQSVLLLPACMGVLVFCRMEQKKEPCKVEPGADLDIKQHYAFS